MRAIVQRVSRASVSIDSHVTGNIGRGYLILLGVGKADDEVAAEKLWQKIWKLRIFQDEQGKTNLDLAAVGGSVLIVSQFTLFANCRKGNRPSFIESAPPADGERLYKYFVGLVESCVAEEGAVLSETVLSESVLSESAIHHVATGIFGADMKVELVNDGPFTVVLDTDQL